MIGEAKVLYYCDSCTAELEIALTATAAGWVGDTAEAQLAAEGWRVMVIGDGIKHYCDGCGPVLAQAILDDLAAQAARDAWNRRQEAEHAKLEGWNTAARQFGTVQP